jgi:hypothetical protein
MGEKADPVHTAGGKGRAREIFSRDLKKGSGSHYAAEKRVGLAGGWNDLFRVSCLQAGAIELPFQTAEFIIDGDDFSGHVKYELNLKFPSQRHQRTD